jgi:predicted membrane chloride channel (bestrophin family)
MSEEQHQPPPPSPGPGTSALPRTKTSKIRRNNRLRKRQEFGGCLPRCCVPLKFVLGLFACRGTIMLHSVPQIVFACGWAVACKLLYDWEPYHIPPIFWTPLYTVTVFLAVFRTNNAFAKYREGRSCLGKMVDALSSTVRMSAAIEGLQGKVDLKEIARLANVVAAMIRVDLRESRIPPGGSTFFGVNPAWVKKFSEGLSDGNDDAGDKKKNGSAVLPAIKPDNARKNHYWASNDDFGYPRLDELLTRDEIGMYSLFAPGKRVVVSTNALINEFSKQAPELAIGAFESHVKDATQARRGAAKIIDSPMPFSYSHLMHLMLFVVIIIGTPVAISSHAGVGWMAVPLSFPAAFLLYGLEEMAHEIENPFGWDVNDHDLTRFCKGLFDECSAMIKWKAATSGKGQRGGGLLGWGAAKVAENESAGAGVGGDQGLAEVHAEPVHHGTTL